MVSNRKFLNSWLCTNTEDCKTVVEFGAGYFDKLAEVHTNVKKKIGIEICKEYITEAKYTDCEIIHGDYRDYRSLIETKDMDCALFVDALEHIKMDDALLLIDYMQKDFNKILLMMPEGCHPQVGGTSHQAHLSTWYFEDVLKLRFQYISLQPNFHKQKGKDGGCFFAIWRRENERRN